MPQMNKRNPITPSSIPIWRVGSPIVELTWDWKQNFFSFRFWADNNTCPVHLGKRMHGLDLERALVQQETYLGTKIIVGPRPNKKLTWFWQIKVEIGMSGHVSCLFLTGYNLRIIFSNILDYCISINQVFRVITLTITMYL